jgi:dihydroxyacetone kinase-like protein
MPDFIQAVSAIIDENAEEVTALDQAIGDGDHVSNLQRGLAALESATDLGELDWSSAFQKIGMTLMSTVGGASGSLFGTLFVSMGKALRDKEMNLQTLSDAFGQGVSAVQQRGKSALGEKTMLDVLIPVAKALEESATKSLPLPQVLEDVKRVAETGVESTRDLLATKGRASFLGERARGFVDPGAKTSALMICAIARVLAGSATPS